MFVYVLSINFICCNIVQFSTRYIWPFYIFVVWIYILIIILLIDLFPIYHFFSRLIIERSLTLLISLLNDLV